MDEFTAKRRLAVALLLSAALHLFPVAAAMNWHIGANQPGRQIVLQATLMAQPPAATPPRARARPPRAVRDLPARAVSQARLEPAKPAPAPESVKPDTAPNREQAPPAPLPDTVPADPERAATLLEAPGAPDYPDEARARGIEACVLAAVTVAADGQVQSVQILHSDAPGVFDQAVIEAHAGARYLPARVGGENRPSRVLALVSFVIEPDTLRNCAFRYAVAATRINALPPDAPIPAGLVEEALREHP